MGRRADPPGPRPRSPRAAAAGPAPVVPELGQPVGAPAEHRDQLAEGQVAGRSGEVLVGGDLHVAEQLGHLGLGRPLPDAHRVEAGIAERQRQVALRREAIVDPAAEAVESDSPATPAPRRCRGPGRVNGPQNGWSVGKSRADARCCRRGPHRRGRRQASLPAAADRRIARRRARRRARPSPPGRRAAAGRCAGCPRHAGRRPAGRRPRPHRSAGACDGSGRQVDRPRRPPPLPRTRRRLAGGEAGGLGGLGGDPGGVRHDGQAFQVAAIGGRRRSRFARRRSRLASLAVDPVDLSSQSRAAASTSLAGRGAARPARKRAWASSLALRTARGSAAAAAVGRRLVVVVGPLGRRRASARPRPGLGRGRPARSARRRAGAARRTGRSAIGRASGAVGADGAEEATSSALAAGASGPRSRVGQAWRRSPGWPRRPTAEAPDGGRGVGSAPPETGQSAPRDAIADAVRADQAARPGWRCRRTGRRGQVGTNRCSTFEVSRAIAGASPASIRGAATGRLGGLDRGEGVVGEGRRPTARDGVRGDGHPDLTRGGGSARRISTRAAPAATPRTRPRPGRRTRWRSRCPHLPAGRASLGVRGTPPASVAASRRQRQPRTAGAASRPTVERPLCRRHGAGW